MHTETFIEIFPLVLSGGDALTCKSQSGGGGHRTEILDRTGGKVSVKVSMIGKQTEGQGQGHCRLAVPASAWYTGLDYWTGLATGGRFP